MNKKNLWKCGLLFFGALILTGCTQSFGTVQDKANVLCLYEQAETDVTDADGNTETKTNLQIIIETVENTGMYYVPSEAFFDYIEENVATKVKSAYGQHTIQLADGQTKQYSDLTVEQLWKDAEIYASFKKTNEYALVKYAKENATETGEVWYNYDLWVTEAVNNGLTLEDVGSTYYHTYMKSQFNTYLTSVTAYITPEDGVFDGLKLEGKSWGEAFHYGLIEGLLVWPISAMLYYFAQAFSSIGAFGTILSIFLVTLIVRGLLLLLTFKQTASQQKMTQLQPELAAIQNKYPNANTNQYEKQQLATEQMALYKKHKINPFGMFIVLIFQFPIFIAVWGAMSGSAILRTGHLWGLQLSAGTGSSIINWSGLPSVVALIIFIIMALMQALSMLLPQFLQKRRTAKVAKTMKNPANDKNASTMKIMNYVMLIMIIIMGFNLPVAMAIYWIISAIISLAQSLIMSAVSNRNIKNGKKGDFVKYKTKKN